VRGCFSGAIEQGGDCVVRHLTCKHTHKIHYLGVGRPTRHADTVFLNLQAGVIATLPVDDEVKMLIVLIHVDNDFRQNCA